jgi:hypothetical protein
MFRPFPSNPIPIELFSFDHWSLLAYVESRAVDHGGRIEPFRFATNEKLHPERASQQQAKHPRPFAWEPRHGTALADRTKIADHDDWHRLEDLAAAGLVKVHEGDRVELTDEGWRVGAELRKHRARGDSWKNYRVLPRLEPRDRVRLVGEPLDSLPWDVLVLREREGKPWACIGRKHEGQAEPEITNVAFAVIGEVVERGTAPAFGGTDAA